MRHSLKMPLVLSVLALTMMFADSALARGRYLHPGLGRFMQRDPLGSAEAGMGRQRELRGFLSRDINNAQREYRDGMNLYQYVNSNPVAYVDPTGLVKVRVDANAFIPQAWVETPFGELKGDNRGISQTPGGSNRIANWIEVELDESISADPKVGSDTSTSPSTLRQYNAPFLGLPGFYAYFHGTGRHSSYERADRAGPCAVLVTLFHEGYVPFGLVPLAPGINYKYEILLEQTGDGSRVSYKGRANHDGFPAYELHIKNSLKYSHDPTVTGEGPASLWGTGEHFETFEGDL